MIAVDCSLDADDVTGRGGEMSLRPDGRGGSWVDTAQQWRCGGGQGLRSAWSPNVGVHVATPGTSALFLLTSDAVLDRVRDGLAQFDFELVSTNLSAEEEQKLREAFEHDEA